MMRLETRNIIDHISTRSDGRSNGIYEKRKVSNVAWCLAGFLLLLELNVEGIGARMEGSRHSLSARRVRISNLVRRTRVEYQIVLKITHAQVGP